ncbi:MULTISPECIES: hypothetical protein [unclassified Streptomyces]|uniref:hypothetical protein n=1 Tax=unclassified Streptomyces TaxID=2593676 RepID=UPI001CBB7512|nr:MULTISPECIES: hypothetical protein [unclassified Streptomyces]WPO71002.1 hypothetical protein R9806_10390 [Streptomyces sp. KN37]
MKTFRRRVNTLLTEFEGSAAGPSKVGGQKIPRAAFSGGGSSFPEADGLYSQYDQVHERLTSLSSMLGQQIEAMGIAVHGADVGFDNLEDDLRQRFWAIQAKVDREQVPTGRGGSGRPDDQGGHGSDKSDAGWS